MLEFEKMLVECTLSNITEANSKSYSVNQKYKAASEEVYSKIVSLGQYDFDSLIEWIKSKRDVWYLGKWKTTKRFIYMMDDIFHNRDFPVDEKYVYFNSATDYQLLKNDKKQLIDDFLIKNDINDRNDIKFSVSCFLSCCERKAKDIDQLSYHDIYEFIRGYASSCRSENVYARSLNHNRRFLAYCYDNGIISNSLLSFIMDKRIIQYYVTFIESDTDMTTFKGTSEVNINSIVNYIEPFILFLSDKGYDKHHLLHIESDIKKYLLFIDLYSLDYCTDAIDLYCLRILKSIIKSYKEIRTLLYRFYDFISGRTVNLNTVYRYVPNRFEKLCPDWARKDVIDYLDYRKRLGFKKSTLAMDTNSILRLAVFLDQNGMNDFNQINVQLLLDFRNSDEHSTLEGKNAYLVRIRQFLIFLADKGITDLYYRSLILKSYRLPKHLIRILDSEILSNVYSHKDDFVTEAELRSYCLFLLGVRLGMRATDAVLIKRKNISFKNMTISFNQQKTQKEVTLPMPMMVANSIYRYMKSITNVASHEYLFQTVHAPFRTPTKAVCNTAVKVVLNKIGYIEKGITFHTLRRTYASNIVNNSHSAYEAAYALGHNGLSTVDQYLHLDHNRMKFCCMDLHLIPFGGFGS